MIARHTFAAPHGIDPAGRHEDFLRLLPRVEQHARCYFRHLGAEAQAEAIAQATALAFAAFRRLQEQGKDPFAFPTHLAAFAAKQVQAGRALGSRQSSTDILSPSTQRRGRFQVHSLAAVQPADRASWQEAVVDNTQTPPADAAAFRIDFAAWLDSLTPRNRQLVELFLLCHTATQVARQLQLSRGRVSQLRQQLARHWYALQGESYPAEQAAGSARDALA
jgi:Sigma-70, region 4